VFGGTLSFVTDVFYYCSCQVDIVQNFNCGLQYWVS